jgi:transposase InsO family protein
MKNLFESATAEEVRERMAHLSPDSARLWGKMNPAQALAHCCAPLEVALGLRPQPRSLIGRLFGRLAKSSILSEKPIARNMPTDKSFVVKDDRDFEAERQRLKELIDRFAMGGPAGCTKHPHSFFGPLTPVEWAELNYKHLDHHLKQFGV